MTGEIIRTENQKKIGRYVPSVPYETISYAKNDVNLKMKHLKKQEGGDALCANGIGNREGCYYAEKAYNARFKYNKRRKKMNRKIILLALGVTLAFVIGACASNEAY